MLVYHRRTGESLIEWRKLLLQIQRCIFHTKYERFEVFNYDSTLLRSNEVSLPKKNMLDLLLYKTYFIGQ